VLDNGTTMVPYWPLLKFVADTLAMKVAPLDDDGIDFRFTIAGYLHNRTNMQGLDGLAEMRRVLDNAEPKPPSEGHERDRSPSDMSATLQEIFNEYWKKNECKATTVIVLTDGKWEGTQPANLINTAIVDFARGVQNDKRNFGDRHFTIGFVQFGEGMNEKLKLKVLDDELCKDNNLK
jgi:hypothetical protein